MKSTFLRISFPFSLALVVFAAAPAFAENAPKSLETFLRSSPVVRGALAQINLPKARYKSCVPLHVEAAPDHHYTAFASCNGSDGETGTEWSEMMTVDVVTYGDDVYRIENIKFDLAG